MRDFDRFQNAIPIGPDPHQSPTPDNVGSLVALDQHFTVVRDLGAISWIGERAHRAEMLLNRAAQFGDVVSPSKRHVTLVPGSDVHPLNAAIARQRPYERPDDVIEEAVAHFTPNKFIEFGHVGVLSRKPQRGLGQWFVGLLLTGKSANAIKKERRQILGRFNLEPQQDLTPHVTLYKTDSQGIAEKVCRGLNRLIIPADGSDCTGSGRLSRPYASEYLLNRQKRGKRGSR